MYFADFAQKVAKSLSEACAESGHAPRDAKLVVALSGGPDSTALLMALKGAMPDCQISACHVNHGLRGAESDGDEEFCRVLCSRLGVPLKIHSLAFKNRRPPEVELREARYKELVQTAASAQADYIVTAHTMDDQIETMLFRMFRGTAPQGLVGISAIRDLKESPGLFLLRPMLKITRRECLAYLKEQGVEARDDSSNQDLSYTRNYIRRVMVPLIGDRFGDFQYRLEQLRSLLEADDALLGELAREHAEAATGPNNDYLHLPTLCQLPSSLSRRILEASLEAHDVEVSFERIRRIEKFFVSDDGLLLNPKSQRLSLNSRWDLRFDPPDRLSWVDKDEAAYNKQRRERLLANSTTIHLPPPNSGTATNVVAWLNKTLKVKAWESEIDVWRGLPALNSASALEAFVDLSRVDGKLEVRMRRAGDVIQPLGMKETVRLKKYIHTHKRGRNMAQLTACGTNIVLACEHEVLWVVGIGLSERIKVFDRPTHHLTWLDLAPPIQTGPIA